LELLVQFLQLVFVLAFGAGDFLITMENPLGGQALQIRAPIPVRADKVIVQFAESGHG
jgi:hypothetical protein